MHPGFPSTAPVFIGVRDGESVTGCYVVTKEHMLHISDFESCVVPPDSLDVELSPRGKRKYKLYFRGLIVFHVLAYASVQFEGAVSALGYSSSRLLWMMFGVFVASVFECVAEIFAMVLEWNYIRRTVSKN